MVEQVSALGDARLQWILRRRSIRRFTEDAVSETDLDLLLQAAMAAPSASNRRPWEFVVVTDGGQLARLRRRLPLGAYKAPAAVVVCGNKRRWYPPPVQDFWVEDCSAAMENLLLAATAIGLGGVWVGVYPIKPLMQGVARVLNLPRNGVPLGWAHIGYPAASRPPRTQYDPRRIHRDRYQAGGEPDDEEAEQLGAETED
jgi:nitroreductase